MQTMAARLARPILFFALLLFALFVLPEGCGSAGPIAFSGDAYSCQLHVHGPYSEGIGSIDSHTYEAAQLGLDVLWWSDHDFRAASYNHVARYGFEALKEPQSRGESWSLTLVRREGDEKGLRLFRNAPGGSAEIVNERVHEGERALRLSTSAETERFQPYSWTFETSRLLHRRPLASGVTVRLAIYPEALDEIARAFIRIDLSEHAPRPSSEAAPEDKAGEEPQPYALRYYLSNTEKQARLEGNVYHIPLAFEEERWNELALDLRGDAARGFAFLPGLAGEDHSLFGLTFGVEARRGGRASVVLDALRIDQELSGAPAFAHQAELLASFPSSRPIQLQGLEVSFAARHLNEFSVDTQLLDYDALARGFGFDPEAPEGFDERGFKAHVIEEAVAAIHAREGLVSWNHMFGVNPAGGERRKSREQQLAILLANKAFGVDLLEVGYRDRAGASLQDHLWVWDRAALAGLRLVGTGVSDSHGGPDARWRTAANNFVSWIYSEAPTKRALIEGLRAGRVFFGDLVHFDGDLDIVSEGGQRMGARVSTRAGSMRVHFLGRGLKAGWTLHLVVDGERAATQEITAEALQAPFDIRVGEEGGFCRFEVYADERAIAFTNPVYFTRDG